MRFCDWCDCFAKWDPGNGKPSAETPDASYAVTTGIARIEGGKLVFRNSLYANLTRRWLDSQSARPAPDDDTPSGATSVAAPAPATPGRVVIAVGTEWWSRHGGLSTFNRELCIALAKAGFSVRCLVPDVADDEREHALASGVELVAAPQQAGVDDQRRLLLDHPALTAGQAPDIVIGHGRVTGLAAQNLQSRFEGARLIHFVHTTPGDIEWFKEKEAAPEEPPTSTVIEARADEELALRAHGSSSCRGRTQAICGLSNAPGRHRRSRQDRRSRAGAHRSVAPDVQPLRIECLLLGRAEDAEQPQGMDIAARALAAVEEAAWPLTRASRSSRQSAGIRRALRARLQHISQHLIDVDVRNFSASLDRIEADIRSASVMLMPSRSEGFGLVALEAVAFGKPVLVSSASGFGDLLQREVPQRAHLFVVDHRGDDEEVVARWTTALQRVLDDLDAAVTNATWLRATLDAKLSWERTVANLLEALRDRVA